MPNYTYRTVVRREVVGMSSAACRECGWRAEEPSIIRSDAIHHVQATGHEVVVEVKQLSSYELEDKGYYRLRGE